MGRPNQWQLEDGYCVTTILIGLAHTILPQEGKKIRKEGFIKLDKNKKNSEGLYLLDLLKYQTHGTKPFSNFQSFVQLFFFIISFMQCSDKSV